MATLSPGLSSIWKKQVAHGTFTIRDRSGVSEWPCSSRSCLKFTWDLNNLKSLRSYIYILELLKIVVNLQTSFWRFNHQSWRINSNIIPLSLSSTWFSSQRTLRQHQIPPDQRWQPATGIAANHLAPGRTKHHTYQIKQFYRVMSMINRCLTPTKEPVATAALPLHVLATRRGLSMILSPMDSPVPSYLAATNPLGAAAATIWHSLADQFRANRWLSKLQIQDMALLLIILSISGYVGIVFPIIHLLGVHTKSLAILDTRWRH